MAHAGGAVTAYRCRLRADGSLFADRSTASSSTCHTVAEAVAIVRAGQVATVEGSDLPALRAAIAQLRNQENELRTD